MKRISEDWLSVIVGFCILGAMTMFPGKQLSLLRWGGIWIFEPVLIALAVGLIIGNLFNVPKKLIKTELFIKIGLVLLGTEILLPSIVKAGLLGMVQAVVVVTAVFFFTLFMARVVGLDDEFAAIIGSGVSICGVSAAIAAGGAIQGDPKKVSHTVSLVLFCAVPMLLLEPIAAKLMGMSPAVTGAWIGGTIDTTAAVVAAGSMAGKEATTVAVIVKMAQNLLIGVMAFLLAIWFSVKGVSGKVDAKQIWTRFPKFVIGFIVASLAFSFLIPVAEAKTVTGLTSIIRTWLFTLAFLSIGFETRFKEFATIGHGKPATVFLTAQGFNILWTLAVAHLLFGAA